MRTALYVISSLIAAQSLLAQDIPKGEVASYTFDKSKIFPGTTRNVTVYTWFFNESCRRVRTLRGH